MKRPSFQFYPADWRNNANLRRCTPAARGAWMDVICVLHDSDEYGVVRWPLAELASAAGAPLKLVRELVEKSVLKGCEKGACEAFVYTPRSGRKEGAPISLIKPQDGPIWYSSRMVRDEYVRTIRGESSRFSETPNAPPKHSPKPPLGDGSTSSSSSSTSTSLKSIEQAPANTELHPGAGFPNPELAKAGALSATLRIFGINATPSDPRIRALADSGTTLDAVSAACEEAKKTKPNERIGIGYVLAILDRWARQAQGIVATGSAQSADEARRAEAKRLLGITPESIAAELAAEQGAQHAAT